MPAAAHTIFFAVATVGSLGGRLLHKSNVPTWVLIPATVGVGLGYAIAVLGMPFHEWPGELIVIILATALIIGASSILARIQANVQLIKEEENTPRMTATRNSSTLTKPGMPLVISELIGLFAVGPAFVLVLFTLPPREDYANRLGWDCRDGVILEKSRDRQEHNAPIVAAMCKSEKKRFTVVDEALWSAAQTGMALDKRPGSPFAMVDALRLRMVPLGLNWWNDPL